MKIISIEYENFRNFKNRGKLEFSTDGKATIVYGKNGAGKTTFHQLFQWIIYGQVHFNKTASDKMYNLDFESKYPADKPFDVMGKIDFSHNGVNYSMTRTWTYQKTIFSTSLLKKSFYIDYQTPNKDWKRVDNPDDLVQQLLPSGLSSYFFFDGENMIADLKVKGKDSAKNLKQALYLMLDLNVYDNIVDLLGSTDTKNSVLGMLYSSKTSTSSDSELQKLGAQRDGQVNKRDKLNDEIDKYNGLIEELESRNEDISEQIGKGTKSQAEYEADRTTHIQYRDSFIDSEKKEYYGFGNTLVNIFPKLMMATAIEKAKEVLKIQAQSSKLPNGLSKTIVDSLLKADKCICGNCIGDNEKQALVELYNYLPPKGYESLYTNFVNNAEEWQQNYAPEQLAKYISEANKYITMADAEDNKIAKIESLMKEDKKHENLVDERNDNTSKIKAYRDQVMQWTGELAKANAAIKHLTKDIDSKSNALEETKILESKLDIIQSLKQYYEQFLLDKSNEYSGKLQVAIQKLLDDMLEAKRTVTVRNDFSLSVVDNFGDEAKSEGQFATVSFAYIGGIFRLLSEENILSNKEFPLVLDAPFSKLGVGPRQKVIDIIPEYAPQIIIMSKDDLQDSFGKDRIGKVYTITSNAEQNIAEIKEGYYGIN